MKRNILLCSVLLALLTMALAISPDVLSAAAHRQQAGPMKPPAKQSQQQQTPPQQQQQPSQQSPQYSVTVESQVVQISAVVTDQDGNIVTGLKKQNFKITDDGQPEPIANFEPNDAPITIVMLVEYDARSWGLWGYLSQYLARGFAEHLGPQDWIALTTFDLKPTIVVDFTHNKQQVEYALETLGFPGFSESNTFDALIEMLDRLKDVRGKKSILLVGTGADTFSKHTLDQTYKALKQTNVTVFCIGSEEIEAVRTGGDMSITYLQQKNEMETFGRLTGGFAWFPRFEGEMPDIFSDVVTFLRNQYSLGYIPPDSFRDGKYHKIKVEVVDDQGNPLMVENKKGKKKKVVVYAREGYIAPPVAAAN
jgi:VWFA-related protein